MSALLPGAAPFDDALQARIEAARESEATVPSSAPSQTQNAASSGSATGGARTRNRDGNVPRFTNRLIFETSPYLRQHAHNPVNWYAWGDEAFDEARRSARPVFLSVGYSTCHWCHVMEQESFEDLEIARLLNERYVAIKLDREERPDVDAVYMTAVQALTRHGGWPMSVWLDSERRPFFAGTYFPAHDGDRGAARGFDSILRELADVYRVQPQHVAEAAESITDAIRSALTSSAGSIASAGGEPEGDTRGDALPAAHVVATARQFYERVYDPVHGGMRGAPKFPSSLPIRVLLREHRRTGSATPLSMAVHTLETMAAGGMHDQLGGGFHRYSTDDRWLVPHFEKMLYDNALLALAYAEAWQVTKRDDFARVLRTTLDYALREMTSLQGGFYSATDADSEGEEGTFFLWRAGEVEQSLGDRAQRFMQFYGVTAHGNFEGKNVLFVPHPDEAEWEALAGPRERLRVAREARPHPLRDEKILTAWNGLMISALAIGGHVLSEPRYIAGAAQAADFVLTQSCVGGRLQRSWKDGRVSGAGFLEDDAFFVAGLLDLYEATFERSRLAAAFDLAARTETLFGDPDGGGWFRSAPDHERLVAREKPMHDGAEPSGASVALRNALRLHGYSGDERWLGVAQRALRAYARQLAEQPASLGEMLLAVDYVGDVPPEIVLVWPRERSAAAFLESLRNTFLPNRTLLGAPGGHELAELATLAPLCAGKTTRDGLPTAYVCEAGACRLPVTDPVAMQTELDVIASSRSATSGAPGPSDSADPSPTSRAERR